MQLPGNGNLAAWRTVLCAMQSAFIVPEHMPLTEQKVYTSIIVIRGTVNCLYGQSKSFGYQLVTAACNWSPASDTQVKLLQPSDHMLGCVYQVS